MGKAQQAQADTANTGVSPPAVFRKAVALYAEGQFFQCHEVLEEELWRRCEDARLASFYQAVIQIAINAHHAQNGNVHGTCALWQRAQDRLKSLGRKKSEWKNWVDYPLLKKSLTKSLKQAETMEGKSIHQAPLPQINLL